MSNLTEKEWWEAFAAKAQECELPQGAKYALMDIDDIRSRFRRELYDYIEGYGCEHCERSTEDFDKMWGMLTWILMCAGKRDLVALSCWIDGHSHWKYMLATGRGARQEGA